VIKTIEKKCHAWWWPEYDTELIKVFDDVDDIEAIVRHTRETMVCVQAGGACGVWPFYLRQKFHTVYTFEPDATNFECLTRNLEGVPGIEAHNAALGSQRGFCHIRRDAGERTNAGAGYIEPGGVVPVVAIDEMRLVFCDLIQLDIEGGELDALLGAYLTIQRFRPVIVIEEKRLPQCDDHLAARGFLERMGYKERGRIHRDVIFTC